MYLLGENMSIFIKRSRVVLSHAIRIQQDCSRETALSEGVRGCQSVPDEFRVLGGGEG